MTYTFYDGTVPLFKEALESLRAIIKEGEKYAAEKSLPADDILNWRLAEDMLPFAFQIHMTADVAVKLVARVQDEAPEEWAYTDIKTLADAYARIDTAEKRLAAANRETFEKRTDATVTLQMGPHIKKDVAARGWAECYGLPNVFFHLTTAYAILRSKGVPLSKVNYITPFTKPWFQL